MFELYAFLSLLSLGYMLSKNTPPASKRVSNVPREDIPSSKNVYHSERFPEVEREVWMARNEAIAKGKDLHKHASVKSKLSGIEMDLADFTHNNMTPFFGSRVKQNMSARANKTVLNNYTGAYDKDIHLKKREVEPMFQRVGNIEDVCGLSVKTDHHLGRMMVGRVRNNERPFQPLNVGPGLDHGFEAGGTGGFQQTDMDPIIRRNVDSLRVDTNPKVTYEGRVIPGAGIGKRGFSGKVFKNKQSLFEERNGERNFTTAAGNEAQSIRPECEAKDTERRTTTTDYFGVATGVDEKAPYIPSAQVKEPSRQQFEDFGVRNAIVDAVGAGESFDHGKGAINLPAQERDLTNQKTYEGNLTSLVKSLTAPLVDMVRTSKKEYLVQHPRTFGGMQPQAPSKLTVKDPNDVARTTIKETNIHDTWDGVLTGPKKITVYDPDDVLRTTTRNTLSDVSNDTNLKGPTRSKANNPDEKLRTTLKETVGEGSHFGAIGNQESGGAYMTTSAEAPATQKEFLSDNDYFGGVSLSMNDGYKVAVKEVPQTQKEFLALNEYMGIAGGDVKPTSYEEFFNAEINVLKEGTLVGRAPASQGAKVGVNADEITVSTKKLDYDYMSSGYQNVERAYMPGKDATDSINQTRNKARIEEENVRFDTCVLSGLKSNPYAMKPLFSGGELDVNGHA